MDDRLKTIACHPGQLSPDLRARVAEYANIVETNWVPEGEVYLLDPDWRFAHPGRYTIWNLMDIEIAATFRYWP